MKKEYLEMTRRKLVKTLKLEVETLKGRLDSCKRKSKDDKNTILSQNQTIGELKDRILSLESKIEEANLAINALKTEKEKTVRQEQKNKKVWLNGFYGEEYEGDK